MVSELNGFGDTRECFATNEMRQAACQVSLGLVIEAPPQEIGDDEAQNSIAEKFEALIAAVGRLSASAAATMLGSQRARMGQGFFEKFRSREEIPDCLREVGGQSMPWTPWNSRPYRIANGHFQISQSRADPFVEKKMNCALPIKFSAGT